MLRSRIRNLLLTVPVAVSAIALAGLTATSASAATTAPAGTAAAGWFHIVNFNSALCLGISGGDDDAPAVQWPCENVDNQEWSWGAEDGFFPAYRRLENNNNQCLGVAGGSREAGARVYGWTCNGDSNQYWYANGNVIYNFSSGLVLGVAGNSTEPGAAVVQWPANGALNQVWTGP